VKWEGGMEGGGWWGSTRQQVECVFYFEFDSSSQNFTCIGIRAVVYS
jgi:hypothetical protein